MAEKPSCSKCQRESAPTVAETPDSQPKVIPFVSREKAEKIYSTQRKMSLKEGWKQVDHSLGRLNDSE